MHQHGMLIGLTLTLVGSALAQDDAPDPVEAILGDRVRSFESTAEGLTGPGADWLIEQAAAAQFVMIGESHGTQETPVFAANLMTALAPHDYDVFCSEIGPVIAGHLSTVLKTDDPMAEITRLHEEYPFSVAFYNWVEECQSLMRIHDAGYRLWGLDQEFAGSGRFLLSRLVNLAPNDEAETLASAWYDMAMAGFERFVKHGDQTAGFLMSVTPEDFDALDEAFSAATRPAKHILAELRASAAIYQLWASRANYESNHDRIQLMKRHFHKYVEHHDDDAMPRAVFKFGSVHMGRGHSPLNQLDLGNMAAEVAAAQGRDSLHMRVFARTRVMPDGTEQDQTQEHLAACFDLASPDHWVVIDVRPLRPHFHNDRNRAANEQMATFVFRYDLVVIAPTFHAATDMVPMAMPGG